LIANEQHFKKHNNTIDLDARNMAYYCLPGETWLSYHSVIISHTNRSNDQRVQNLDIYAKINQAM